MLGSPVVTGLTQTTPTVVGIIISSQAQSAMILMTLLLLEDFAFRSASVALAQLTELCTLAFASGSLSSFGGGVATNLTETALTSGVRSYRLRGIASLTQTALTVRCRRISSITWGVRSSVIAYPTKTAVTVRCGRYGIIFPRSYLKKITAALEAVVTAVVPLTPSGNGCAKVPATLVVTVEVEVTFVVAAATDVPVATTLVVIGEAGIGGAGLTGLTGLTGGTGPTGRAWPGAT